MRALRMSLILFIVVVVQLIPVYFCFASPSSNFYQQDGDILDDWYVSRTRPYGENGYLQEIYTGPNWPPSEFRPVIAFESLGEYADIAYQWGDEFAEQYTDRYQRAEKIFYFVRDKVQYEPDIDQFGLDEFAENADEVANTIERKGSASSDCEEMAILLAIMYQGAGYRSAIVDCASHVGVMVYLPGYEKANVVFELDGEPGWVWAEATGNTNRFGWFPQGQIEGPMLAYEISAEPIARVKPAILAWNLSTFNFSATQGGQNPASQTLEISNSGYGTIEWSVADDAAWLTPSPTSGTSTGEADDVTFSVDISGMSAGSYSAAVTISAPGATNSPQTVSVSLGVAPVEQPPPTIAWSPLSFNFSATQGGQNPASQTLEISNPAYGAMEWSVTDSAAWLTLSPASGTSTGEADDVTFSVDISGMSAGSYSAAVTISAPGATNSPQTVWVSLDVAPSPSDASPLIGILIFLVVVGLMVTIILLRRRRRA